MKHRAVLLALLAGVGAGCAIAAENYPVKPVRVVVPFPTADERR